MSETDKMPEASLGELERLQAEYEKMAREKGVDLLKREFTAFFEANPKVRALAWTQYTPYFNDGDPCVFSVRDMYGGCRDLTAVEIDELPKWLEEEGDEYGFESADRYHGLSSEGDYFKRYGKEYDSDAGYPLDQEKYETLKSIDEATGALQSRLRKHKDLFKRAFGDHVQVVATRQGFTIKDIDHD